MNDKTLTKTMADAGMPQYMIDIALKMKNNNWAAYEKEFRIHSYNAYSDPGYWNSKLKATGGSYMGNPTGIYSKDESPIYVFVDQDIRMTRRFILQALKKERLSSTQKPDKSFLKD